MNPVLDVPRLAAVVEGLWPGAGVHWAESLGSTNDAARALGQAGAAHGTVVVAEMQTAGRGRRGARWEAAPGRNLLMSVLLRPGEPIEEWPRLTHALALAGCAALEAEPGLPAPRIKWPNDLMLRDRKVCGILVESVCDARGGYAVAGIGVNLNVAAGEMPDEIRGLATSVLAENGGSPVDRTGFTCRLLEALARETARLAADFPSMLTALEQRSWLAGHRLRVLCGGRELLGDWAGLGPGGELLLRSPDGTCLEISSADLVRRAPWPPL